MQLDFKRITINDHVTYEKYRPFYPENYGWEYSFAMTWIWDAFDETLVCDAGDMAFVSSKFFGTRVYYPPFLKNPTDFPKALKLIEEACKKENVVLDVRGLLKSQIDMLDTDKYTITTLRENCDYVYNTQDLIQLSGKKFHSKRNFITRFKNSYPDYIFRDYDEAKDRKNMLALYHKWHSSTDHETLALEEKVINHALDSCKALHLKIGVLYVGETLVAFSVSCTSNPRIAHTFFEKADKDFIGSYQAINQFSAQKYLSDIPYVNRQEDLGIEGLRKAKLSYHPEILVEKYRIQSKK